MPDMSTVSVTSRLRSAEPRHRGMVSSGLGREHHNLPPMSRFAVAERGGRDLVDNHDRVRGRHCRATA